MLFAQRSRVYAVPDQSDKPETPVPCQDPADTNHDSSTRPTDHESTTLSDDNAQHGVPQRILACASLFYDGDGENEIPWDGAEIGALIEDGTIADDTMVYSDQPAFCFDTWTAWSECKQCFSAEAAAKPHSGGIDQGSAQVHGRENIDQTGIRSKNEKNERRKDRKVRENQEAEKQGAKQEDAMESQENGDPPPLRVLEVDSFGVGPDNSNVEMGRSRSHLLDRAVRDIQLRWDGTIHTRRVHLTKLTIERRKLQLARSKRKKKRR